MGSRLSQMTRECIGIKATHFSLFDLVKIIKELLDGEHLHRTTFSEKFTGENPHPVIYHNFKFPMESEYGNLYPASMEHGLA